MNSIFIHALVILCFGIHEMKNLLAKFKFGEANAPHLSCPKKSKIHELLFIKITNSELKRTKRKGTF